nr:potassium channel family protein [uncultured Ruminococcus sp.]
MKKTRLLKIVLKRTGAFKLLCTYIVVFVAVSIGIMIVEPNINRLIDSLWYSFSVATTIGFGDITAVTLIGRILSIFLSICSILIIAVVPGIITSYYIESTKLREKESSAKFLDDLERLPELSKEELTALSERVKNFNKKKK